MISRSLFRMAGISNKFLFIAALCLIAPAATSCEKKRESGKFDLSNTAQVHAEPEKQEEETIRITIGGMITPGEGFTYYRKLPDHIDAAFVCGGPDIDGHRESGVADGLSDGAAVDSYIWKREMKQWLSEQKAGKISKGWTRVYRL